VDLFLYADPIARRRNQQSLFRTFPVTLHKGNGDATYFASPFSLSYDFYAIFTQKQIVTALVAVDGADISGKEREAWCSI
jgi:hypothetical protein